MAITKIYKGDVERSDIQKIYKGTTLLYEKVLPQGETWVINESPNFNTEVIDFVINFTSNNNNYTMFYARSTGINEYISYYKAPSYQQVYVSGTWNNQAYRTVIFETAPTGDLLTWLEANAVKQ